jgi:peptide/nickel transport system substrate-binding protein
VRVRRALSLATDRAEALATVLGGSGKVGAVIPESQIGGYDGVSELPYYTTNIDEAKKLLAEAGYPNGIDLGDYIVVAANDLDVACAQILQQQWAKAGITIAIKPMETAPLLEMANKGTYPTMLSVALSWSPDPDSILNRNMSTTDYGKNQGFSDTVLDEMITRARATVDPEARAALNRDITAHMADNAYMLHIYQYPLRWEMWWNYVKGYHALSANIRTYVRTTWLDK